MLKVRSCDWISWLYIVTVRLWLPNAESHTRMKIVVHYFLILYWTSNIGWSLVFNNLHETPEKINETEVEITEYWNFWNIFIHLKRLKISPKDYRFDSEYCCLCSSLKGNQSRMKQSEIAFAISLLCGKLTLKFWIYLWY